MDMCYGMNSPWVLWVECNGRVPFGDGLRIVMGFFQAKGMHSFDITISWNLIIPGMLNTSYNIAKILTIATVKVSVVGKPRT